MFRHYSSEVREKGALTTFSTDRTEIWHKILKAAYSRSNRNDTFNEFIVRYVSRITAFRLKVSGMNWEVPKEEVSPVQSADGTTSGKTNHGVELEADDHGE